MLTGAMTSRLSPMPPAALQPMRRPARPYPVKDAVSLRLQSLVDPPVHGEDSQLSSYGVWVSNGEPQPMGTRALTARHLTLQGLLLKLQLLAGSEGPSTNWTLRLLTEGHLTHVYVTSADFSRLVGEVPPSQPYLAAQAAFIDDAREWLVVDSQQSFIATSAEPSSALITSLAQLAEPPPAVRRRLASSAADSPLRALLLDTARKLTRLKLGESDISLSGQAAELAECLGEVNLVHWLLADLPLHHLPSIHSGRG